MDLSLSILTAGNAIWLILKNWWWLILPFLLYRHFVFYWHWYKAEKWDATVKKTILEIKIPKEIIKPIKAMEQVFSGFHGLHDVFDWREKWWNGEFMHSISFEIASLEGKTHFFIRAPEKFRTVIESNIYAQYPEAEISAVDDYTKSIPQNIPNKDWDLFGFDMEFTKKSCYPLITYRYFEESKELVEEKRLDPLAGLLDGMSTLGPGEQMWLQIVAKPVLNKEEPWQTEGKAIVNELVHRKAQKTVWKSIPSQVAGVYITGLPPSDEGEKMEEETIIPPEMKLTPGERDIVKAIEDKIAKFGFVTFIRFLYLAKKDVFFKPKARIPYGYFKSVSSEYLIVLKPLKKTMHKVHWLLKKSRTYVLKRVLFRRYSRRFSTYFPKSGGTYVLNTEELATLYHFPGWRVAPAPFVPRIEAKKGEAPAELPIED
ncbi:MAG: hypothetical protein NTU58_00120 [Candidatus Nealsonbacteria bacterium]|nr:hypothetical protein [Candidatus Nealsonbacteria bacterium]